jgi:hypothetical protein
MSSGDSTIVPYAHREKAINEMVEKLFALRSHDNYDPMPEFYGSRVQLDTFLAAWREGWKRYDAKQASTQRMIAILNRMTPRKL